MPTTARSEPDRTMKLKYFFFGLLLASTVYGFAVILRAQEKASPPQTATLRIDRTPVGEGAGVVTSYADALADVRPAVVSVHSTKMVRQRAPAFPFNDPFFRRFFGPEVPQEQVRPEQGLGSGVIVSPEGYILTNNHVVEGADELLVRLADSREFPARIVGSDPRTDIAVIRIDAPDLPTAVLGDSDALRVGDIVFALGNPLGIGQTATMGIVSATGRRGLGLLDRRNEPGYEDFIQTDAAINFGNSGGALVDARGRVIGINTAILSTTRGNIGIGFAVPINLASFVMNSLIETGVVARGYLGVNPQDLDAALAAEFGLKDARGGVLIADIVPDGPAQKAGLRRGDVLLSLDGRPVTSADELRLRVSQLRPGSKVEIEYLRGGERSRMTIELGTLPGSDVAPGRGGANQFVEGIEVSRITDELRQELQLPDDARGVVVTAVDRRSRYASLLQMGAVIEQVNQRPVSDPREAREALRPGRNLLLVNFRGVRRFVAFELH
jgi:Do/DeqQ family serine protease